MVTHLISSKQFESSKQLHQLFLQSRNQRKRVCLPYGIMASLFFEPSTRTRLSFESAMHRLGGQVITVSDGDTCSQAKGESLEDTIATVCNYADIIVLRHPNHGGADRASRVSSVPIINAGDGAGEHPTQALLDTYTLWEHSENKGLDGMHIALAGDFKFSRTIHSLLHLLNLYEGIHLHCVQYKGDDYEKDFDPREYIEGPCRLAGHYIYKSMDELLDAAPPLKAIYQTRLQKERWSGNLARSVTLELPHFIQFAHMQKVPEDCIIMHPLPRNREIDVRIDQDRRAVYFNKQLHAGLKCRMSLIENLYFNRLIP